MKHFILIVFGLIFLPLAISAQPIITSADIPSIGQIYNYQFTKQDGVTIGSTGINQVWDYSNLIDTNVIRIDSFLSVGFDLNASLFPGTNLSAHEINVSDGIITRNQYDYFIKDVNSLKTLGYINSGITYLFRNPTSPLTTYPFTYGDFYTDSSTLVIQYSNVIDSVKYTDSTYAVGYGILKLPGNRTYTNVLQLRTEITIRTNFSIGKSVNLMYWVPGTADVLFTMDITNGIPTQIRYLTNYTSLPLRWLDFSGVAINRKNKLSWRTAYEKNTKNFLVERSIDGKNFKSIKQLPTVENSVSETSYTYVDNSPESGENYYRIKAIDKDGSINYTKTILLNLKQEDLNVRTYPTIATTNVFLEFTSSSSHKVGLQIIDEAGKLIQKKSYQLITGSSKISLNISGLSKGMYQIIFDNPNLNTTAFIKD